MSLMSLLDKEIIMQDQPPKIYIDGIKEQNKKSITKTLQDYNQGIFTLSSKLGEKETTQILDYLNRNYVNYSFAVASNPINQEIIFSKIKPKISNPIEEKSIEVITNFEDIDTYTDNLRLELENA